MKRGAAKASSSGGVQHVWVVTLSVRPQSRLNTFFHLSYFVAVCIQEKQELDKRIADLEEQTKVCSFTSVPAYYFILFYFIITFIVVFLLYPTEPLMSVHTETESQM